MFRQYARDGRIVALALGLLMLLAEFPLPQGLRVADTATASVAIDSPSPASAFPGFNTWGYTNVWPTLHASHSDVSDPLGFDVPMDIGDFNNLGFVTTATAYWMNVDFSTRIRMWNDGNGAYDPADPCPTEIPCTPVGDDRCPTGPINLFNVAIVVNNIAHKLRTVQGTLPGCGTSGDPVESPPVAVIPDPDHPTDPVNRFYIPKEFLDEYANGVRVRIHCFQLRFTPVDLVLPAYGPNHVKSEDGVFLQVNNVMVQLVAPPLFISHGRDGDLNPPIPYTVADVGWMETLRLHIRNELILDFGQDPWAWAPAAHDGIYLNVYDPKQGIRWSGYYLGNTIATQETALGWSPAGKVWLHGHSMGGLVSRWYIEQLGGKDHVSKLGMDATPNLGATLAKRYTKLFSKAYAQADDDHLGQYLLFQGACNPQRFLWWDDWWESGTGAYLATCSGSSPGVHDRDLLADHELKPAGRRNPILRSMDDAWLANRATLPEYFVVRTYWSDCDNWALQLIWPCPSDGFVTLDSATMNNHIRHRTVEASNGWRDTHEQTPTYVETGIWLARYYANLRLDDGAPNLCYGPPLPPSQHPGDNPDGGTITYEQNSCANTNEEETSLTTNETITFDFPIDTGVSHAVFEAAGGASIEVKLRDPNGAIYWTGGGPGITYTAVGPNWMAPDTIHYEVANPIPGTWSLLVRRLVADDVPIIVSASVDSIVTLDLTSDSDSYTLGQPVKLQATVKNGNLIAPGFTVEAYVPDSNGFQTLPLTGSGVHTGVWFPPAKGEYDIRVKATGPDPNWPGATLTRVCDLGVIVNPLRGLPPRPDLALPLRLLPTEAPNQLLA